MPGPKPMQRPQRQLLSGALALASVTVLARLTCTVFVGPSSSSKGRSLRHPIVSLNAEGNLFSDLFKDEETKKAEAEAKVEQSKAEESARLQAIAKRKKAAEETRKQLSKDLEALALKSGVEASNQTRSDLTLRRLLEEKVVAMESAAKTEAKAVRSEVTELEARMISSLLTDVEDDVATKVTNYELAVSAAEEGKKLKEALKNIAELEEKLEASESRSSKLLNGIKEIGAPLGVGGLGGMFSFMMSDEDLVKDVKMRLDLLQKKADKADYGGR
eukprot:TRINITY_DN67998_c0_g1_i1.p1 TRINITY_DN67998_c0_g1~~TRINITY_DN67998_c0_g1_i1.p1  ORF type:complete len:274 (+),score=84.61 TRINITY_DN67998_c0_g1_i1:92-913(+)